MVGLDRLGLAVFTFKPKCRGMEKSQSRVGKGEAVTNEQRESRVRCRHIKQDEQARGYASGLLCINAVDPARSIKGDRETTVLDGRCS